MTGDVLTKKRVENLWAKAASGEYDVGPDEFRTMVDPHEALRARVAELEAEVERLRKALYDGTPDCRHGCILVQNLARELDEVKELRNKAWAAVDNANSRARVWEKCAQESHRACEHRDATIKKFRSRPWYNRRGWC